MSGLVSVMLWLATVVGIAGPSFAFGVVYARRVKHVHEWGRWEPWGVLDQERVCQSCGKRKLKGR